MEAILGNVLWKGAAKLCLDPACGSAAREAIHLCLRAMFAAEEDNSCAVFSQHLEHPTGQ